MRKSLCIVFGCSRVLFATLALALAPPLLAQTGPIAHWKLDESSGTSAADSSGNGNTGTLTNPPLWEPLGRVGGSLDFNGSTGLVSVSGSGNLANLQASGMTVTAWIKTGCDWQGAHCRQGQSVGWLVVWGDHRRQTDVLERCLLSGVFAEFICDARDGHLGARRSYVGRLHRWCQHSHFHKRRAFGVHACDCRQRFTRQRLWHPIDTRQRRLRYHEQPQGYAR